MANAKQCDRCKVFYIPNSLSESKRKQDPLHLPIFSVNRLVRSLNNEIGGYSEYDLCAKCQEELDALLNNFFKNKE